MTKVKFCGLRRMCDISAANALRPDYIGFVFAPKSRRYVSVQQAQRLRAQLRREICAVGVFVNEAPKTVAQLLNSGVIDMAQLHGAEDAAYLCTLRALTQKPLVQAFLVRTEQDIIAAQNSAADYVLLDSGCGSGKAFDWGLLRQMSRPYFLAGGLSASNVGEALCVLHPFAVDVSSGIETDGCKDMEKMSEFIRAVRGADSRPDRAERKE